MSYKALHTIDKSGELRRVLINTATIEYIQEPEPDGEGGGEVATVRFINGSLPVPEAEARALWLSLLDE